MDKHYWERYYQLQRQADPTKVQHSLFAEFVLSELADRDLQACSLLELGCGNGRDSLFFAHHNLNITAIDQAREQIAQLSDHAQSHPYAHKPVFIAGDFTRLEEVELDSTCRFKGEISESQKRAQYDCIYSRFTLHSISKVQQDKVLEDCLEYCALGGILAIEVRGECNGLFGKGEPVVRDGELEHNAFIYDDHYRRFLNFTQTCTEIESLRSFAPCLVDSVDSAEVGENASHENILVGGGYMIIHLYAFLLRNLLRIRAWIYLQILSFALALRFSMRARIGDLRLLMARMITSSVLLRKRCASHKAFGFSQSLTHFLIHSQFCPSSRYTYNRDHSARIL